MNKVAVAMAADSAVTITTWRGAKTYNTVNKLFALSRRHPVGIMIYHHADVMGVPWELVVKLYRERLGARSFPTVEAYVEDFQTFLVRHETLFPREAIRTWIERVGYELTRRLHDDMERHLEERLARGEDVTPETHRRVARDLLAAEEEAVDAAPLIPDLAPLHAAMPADMEAALRQTADTMADALDLPSEKDAAALVRILRGRILRAVENETHTGIVVAGYGEDEHYPVMIQVKVEAVIEGRLRAYGQTVVKVTEEAPSVVQAFAQRDMAHAFMEGADPALVEFERQYLDHLMQRLPDALMGDDSRRVGGKSATVRARYARVLASLKRDFTAAMRRYRHERHVLPVLDAVAMLSKDDLASLAQSLVNLTSLKRRVSLDLETVGGPIDVAVISKVDGFIWVHRKHYFDPRLNPSYMARINAFETKDG